MTASAGKRRPVTCRMVILAASRRLAFIGVTARAASSACVPSSSFTSAKSRSRAVSLLNTSSELVAGNEQPRAPTANTARARFSNAGY